jgi:hypothetical protein
VIDEARLTDELKQRRSKLEAEMNRVAQQAAAQASLPYQSAIGEIDNILKMIAGDTEV